MEERTTMNIPVIALRGLTVFPDLTLSFDVEREISIYALDSAMEGDLSRVWKIALVTLFYLCIETFFAFLLDYSRDIVVQRVGRGLAAVEELRVDVERAELAGRIPERLTFGADAHGVGFKQPRYDRVIHGFASLAVFVFCYYKGWRAKKEERREICADKKWTQGCAAGDAKTRGTARGAAFFAAQFAGSASG